MSAIPPVPPPPPPVQPTTRRGSRTTRCWQYSTALAVWALPVLLASALLFSLQLFAQGPVTEKPDDRPVGSAMELPPVADQSEQVPKNDASPSPSPAPAAQTPATPAVQSQNDTTPPELSATDDAQPAPQPVPAEDEAPPAAPLQTTTIVHSTAVAGQTLGVARIEIMFGDGQCPTWYPDDSLIVDEERNQIRYPATELFFEDVEGATAPTLRRAIVHFLFLGAEPLVARIGTSRNVWIERCEINLQEETGEYRFLLDSWWHEYCRDAEKLQGNARFVRQLMQRVLARRFGYAVPTYPHQELNERPIAALERNFERSISTLLGIDSLLLAVPDIDRRNYDDAPMPANLPMPGGIAIPAVRIPAVSNSVTIEPLADQVPQDCFYLRCGSLSDLLWLREFVTSWGGSLHEIVSVPSLEKSIRPKLERQLALGADRSQELGIDATISDMAIIGCDFFFQEGAAVGVLFEAKDSRQLRRLLQRQRAEVIRDNPLAQQKAVQVGDYPVSLLSTDDHSVRSFYASKGRYHLVSNSAHIVRQFLRIQAGRGSLGRLNEFRYARHQLTASEPSRAFIYLSDPFFRQLASPHYRIELIRRGHSLAESHELAVAALVGNSIDGEPATVENLIASNYLRQSFGKRTDGSQMQLVDGQVIDSLRGRRGTYLPIPDVPISRITSGEQTDYRLFASRYQQQWGRVDPLLVTISSQAARGGELDRVKLGIHITPFARQRYSFLARHLAPATTQRAQPVPGDLLRVDAQLKDRQGKRFQVHLGLQDSPVTFEIQNGAIQRTDVANGRLFSQTNHYVAVSPRGPDGLQLVQLFLAELQQGSTAPPTRTAQARGGFDPLTPFIAILFPERLMKVLLAAATAESISNGEVWTVYARQAEIRDHVLAHLQMTTASTPAQVRLAMADPNQARVADYVHAFSYLESRKLSAQNAQLLNDLHAQLGLAPESALTAATVVFDAEPICALGGSYKLQASDSGPFWKSSAWNESSLYQIEKAPEDYRFPFLSWLRGADVLFTLSSNTLTAEVELQVSPVTRHEVQKPKLGEGRDRDERADESLQPATALKAGDLVVIAGRQATLRVGQKSIARLPQQTELMVVEVRGRWIGVWGFQRDKAVRGWLLREELARE